LLCDFGGHHKLLLQERTALTLLPLLGRMVLPLAGDENADKSGGN
jgi:hypothetical protein